MTPFAPSTAGRALVGAAYDACLLVDSAWRLTSVNAAAEELLCTRGVGLAGASLWSVLPLVDGSSARLALVRAMTLGIEERTGDVRVAADRIVDVRAMPFEGGLVLTLRDASDRGHLEHDLRLAEGTLRALAESIPRGVIALDAAGCPTYLNAVAHRVLADLDVDRAALGALVASRTASGERWSGAVVGRAGAQLQVAVLQAPNTERDGPAALVVFDDPALGDQAARPASDGEAQWLGRIRQAIDEDRFVLYAQPIVDLRSGRNVQHELLIRMVDERGDLVAPGLFLPVAERFGLIAEIDAWVIARAAALAAAGHAVEVNLSAESLADPALGTHVGDVLRGAGADPGLIVFELTETALLRNQVVAAAFIRAMKALGSTVALDDFGTGYGGFIYLKHLPVNCLKIDVEFVADLVSNPASEKLVGAVVHLADAFGLKTIAEGVEDAPTLELLRALGVDEAQGYHIARPAPVEMFLPGSATIIEDHRDAA